MKGMAAIDRFSAPNNEGVHFTLPTPPSTNALFKNVKGMGRVKTLVYKDFIQRGLVAIRDQNVQSIRGDVICIAGVERMSGRADIDNRLKAMLDITVKAGIIDDDSCITAIAISWLPPANGLAHLTFLPTGAVALQFHPSQSGACGGWFIDAPKEM